MSEGCESSTEFRVGTVKRALVCQEATECLVADGFYELVLYFAAEGDASPKVLLRRREFAEFGLVVGEVPQADTKVPFASIFLLQ